MRHFIGERKIQTWPEQGNCFVCPLRQQYCCTNTNDNYDLRATLRTLHKPETFESFKSIGEYCYHETRKALLTPQA